MRLFPVFLKLAGAPCLVVGGGPVAARKVAALRRAGARVTVVAPELTEELAERKQRGEIEHIAETFRPERIEDQALVIAATGDRGVDAAVAERARARRIPVNAVDQPELCSYITPAVVDRSPLMIAITSGGAAPVLARLLRARLEALIPAAYGRLAALAGRFREEVAGRLSSFDRRMRFWESVFDGPVAEHALAGREAEARRGLERALERAAEAEGDEPLEGEVYLVGGGPGDPDLLTFRALRLMQRADVVLYDRLVTPGVLELVRRDAERVYVGKARGRHSVAQQSLNEQLVAYARAGNRVLRLKGGDPFLFGRGGEEIEQLAAEGIPFQVVPGVTAANGCAAYAGIPLTHRDHAQACRFLTGHRREGEIELDWRSLANPHETLVFYMGLEGLPVICRRLIEHGLPASHSAALVQQGTTPAQRTIAGTLETLPGLVQRANVRAPTLLIVGTVVALQERLGWFRGSPDAEQAFDAPGGGGEDDGRRSA